MDSHGASYEPVIPGLSALGPITNYRDLSYGSPIQGEHVHSIVFAQGTDTASLRVHTTRAAMSFMYPAESTKLLIVARTNNQTHRTLDGQIIVPVGIEGKLVDIHLRQFSNDENESLLVGTERIAVGLEVTQGTLVSVIYERNGRQHPIQRGMYKCASHRAIIVECSGR
jgi:hypothetical protein